MRKYVVVINFLVVFLLILSSIVFADDTSAVVPNYVPHDWVITNTHTYYNAYYGVHSGDWDNDGFTESCTIRGTHTINEWYCTLHGETKTTESWYNFTHTYPYPH